jgi:hypothetical protein
LMCCIIVTLDMAAPPVAYVAYLLPGFPTRMLSTPV